MASFPSGLSFRALLLDSREIFPEGLGEKENTPRRALNLAFIHGCSSTTQDSSYEHSNEKWNRI